MAAPTGPAALFGIARAGFVVLVALASACGFENAGFEKAGFEKAGIETGESTRRKGNTKARLIFDARPGSPSLGTLTFDLGANDLPLGEGAAVEPWLVVWTGEVSPRAPGCRHPEDQPSILGSWSLADRRLVFAPRFPWVAGTTYTACADLEGLERTRDAHLQRSRKDSVQHLVFAMPKALDHVADPGRPRVTGVWPLSGRVPANLLRFYVEFSEPMVAKDVASKVALVDSSGQPIADAFVDIPNGLWDPDQTRLTLFVHPGRIKRGVGPNQRLGPVLRPGDTVRLRVGSDLESRSGGALNAAFERTFAVGPADRTRPDSNGWIVEPPASSGLPVTVRFDEPLDRAQLLRFASIRDGEGAVLEGQVRVGEDGLSWSFWPSELWRSGTYQVRARSDIEDLAGNTPERLFEVETAGAVDAGSSSGVALSSVEPPDGGVIALGFAFAD